MICVSVCPITTNRPCLESKYSISLAFICHRKGPSNIAGTQKCSMDFISMTPYGDPKP